MEPLSISESKGREEGIEKKNKTQEEEERKQANKREGGQEEGNIPFPSRLSTMKGGLILSVNNCEIVDTASSLFKTKVTIHLLCAKPHALKIKMKQNKAVRQRPCLQTLSSLAEESDNMIRIYCKLLTSNAFPPLSGKILP